VEEFKVCIKVLVRIWNSSNAADTKDKNGGCILFIGRCSSYNI
jgi:hypothetical protein